MAYSLWPIACLLLAGCAVYGDKKTGIVQGVQQVMSTNYQLNAKLKQQPPRLVAILPFENLTGKTAAEEEKGAEAVIRTAFANHFTTRRYETQRTVVTDRLLQEKGLLKAEAIAQIPVKQLAEITKADAVIYGQITHFDRIYVGVYSQIAVGAKLRMVDVQTGEILWEAADVSRKHSGGFSTEPLGLLIALASNAYALRHIEVVRASEELFRSMVQTIPSVAVGEAVRPPTITLLVNDSSMLTRKAGDQIKVGIQGEPNMLATFDLGPYRTGVMLTEVQPGVYTGAYTVKPGDNAESLIVVGHLSDRKGLVTNWEDVLGAVTLDTTPPAVPSMPAARGRDRTASLKWKANTEPDLAGYKLYRSATALTGYTLVASTETPSFIDTKELTNQQSYYYKVSAYDTAGNESTPSETITAVPVAPGPTPVSGTIALNATWLAGASPYVLEGEVIVSQGAVLTIEPGTVVKSKGAGLTVRGSLMAKGTPEEIILLTTEAGSQWRGIQFDQTGEQDSVLEHVRISRASVGISCLAASPKILASEIADNGTGVLVQYASSHPRLERNQIMLNGEDGVSVQDAAMPTLIANKIAQNKRHGVAVAKSPGFSLHGNEVIENAGAQLWNGSATEVVEASGNWWGTADGAAVVSKVEGPVLLKDYLSGPVPDGKTVALSVLDPDLGGVIAGSAHLLAAKSPYLLTKPLVIQKGGRLSIQAGVVIRFKPGDNSILIKEGSIQALGTSEHPIVFTSANSSPRPGDYSSALRFEGEGDQPSLLRHIRIEYAATAVQVKEGTPEISHAFIAHNLQSALECMGKSSPKVTYSTLSDHPNNAAVVCGGRAQPTLYRNNIVNNAWAVINHSTLPLEARENWWGAVQPDEALFLGIVEFKPFLNQPEPDAKGR
jgi:parallel beta-helix repeat protein